MRAGDNLGERDMTYEKEKQVRIGAYTLMLNRGEIRGRVTAAGRPMHFEYIQYRDTENRRYIWLPGHGKVLVADLFAKVERAA